MERAVLVPVADGSEEIETVCLIDILRRAGARVVVASVEPRLQITASRGVNLVADSLIEACLGQSFDLIALPGGMPGAERLAQCAPLLSLLQRQKRQQRYFAALCAAPAVVLEPHGLLEGCRATAHPAFVERLSDPSAAANRVVVDGHCVTSRGPGTALEFALVLVELLFGAEKARQVADPLVLP
ncbi:DJ-1 family glyoxalase III [Motiliproteus sp. SC1-56]|uniref:DJ-1 family glyoxalase III n=1 Tax=Motiliproteus sp. SC1-56 TaxID=2799565 RepID=UPI001A8C6EB8|nr:DJ-1 family glyoxalase III [Motiliproteus sp. SC1-56]